MLAYSAGIFVLRSRLKEVKTEETSTCFGCKLSVLLRSTPWLSYIVVGTDYMSFVFSLFCVLISAVSFTCFLLSLDHLLSLCIV